MNQVTENDAKLHAERMRSDLEQLVVDLREGVGAVEDARAQALFETAAEVLEGLQRAFVHYEEKSEAAWR